MKEQENRNQNRKVGLILGLLFVGLFTITTLGFILGLDAPPVIKTIVSVIATFIVVIIGTSLIGAAFYEMVVQTIIRKIEKRRARRISE